MNKNFLSVLLFLFAISTMPFKAVANRETQLSNDVSVHEEQQNQIVTTRIAIIELVDTINLKKTMTDLIHASRDNKIFGILLLIDSSGGRCDTFSALHDLIKKITTIKPVVSLVIGSALSCGYHCASATNYIITQSASEVGNIGVAMLVERHKKLKITGNTNADLDIELFHAGEFKVLNNVYAKKLSATQKKYIENNLNRHYQLLIKSIAQNRGLGLENHTMWAEGKSFIAPDALRLGLIDEIGTIFEAETKLLELIRKNNSTHTFSNDIEEIIYVTETNNSTKSECQS